MIIWKIFERNFAKNCVKNGVFLQNNSVENSLICPKNKSASHCPTELFPIYPNNHWTIRWRDGHIVVPSSNRIKLKIDRFHIKDSRLENNNFWLINKKIIRLISKTGTFTYCIYFWGGFFLLFLDFQCKGWFSKIHHTQFQCLETIIRYYKIKLSFSAQFPNQYHQISS